MGDDDVPPTDRPGGATAVPAGDSRTSRATGLWWKILLFAAGVLVGVLGVGLLNVTTPDFAAASASGGASAGGQGQGPRTGPAGAEARVNAACLGVINEAQDVYAVLGDLGKAVDDVDLTALDDIVRRLQPIEPRLGRDLTGCRVDTSVSTGGTSAGPVAPSSGPSSAVPTTGVDPTTPVPQPSPTR